MTKLIIGEILNRQTDEEIRELRWLIGKEVIIFTLNYGEPMIFDVEHSMIFSTFTLNYGEPMIFDVEHSMIFSTTNVISIDETDYGIWIETEKAIYRFDNSY